ncbi:MAG TPA: thiamine phosphate synthase [Blastocatellia bacterium]|nr:thiamine phosphate synthase [Blastocatellia bacterium]
MVNGKCRGLIPDSSRPLLYLITDRRRLARRKSKSEIASLFDFVSEAFNAGVDMAQIREPDLCARELCGLLSPLVEKARRYDARVLVNDRADVAAATGAGVHLTTRSIPIEAVRKSFGPDLLIGASTHSMKEAEAAQTGGADFIVFGPVFETASKIAYGPPVGLDPLAEAAARLHIPVLALGGINMTNFRMPLERGAAGVAAISLFVEAENLVSVVKVLKDRV